MIYAINQSKIHTLKKWYAIVKLLTYLVMGKTILLPVISRYL